MTAILPPVAQRTSTNVVDTLCDLLHVTATPAEKTQYVTYLDTDLVNGVVTPSPFDAYLAGDAAALTPEQKKGVDTFIAAGCTTCHMGTGIGGEQFQKLGLVVPYETADLGRYDVTKVEADKHVFKVPSLRNITETAPYFHDGKVATLDEAIRLMGKHQLGLNLEEREVSAIVEWLGSLTGRIPTEYIKPPLLPASTDQTPKPDPT